MSRNRLPTASLPSNKTPYEVAFGKKPSLQHLRVFRCRAYVMIQKDQRKSLQPHSMACIFLGYSEEIKGWRCYDPVSKKIIVSRDVIFNESECPGLSTKSILTGTPVSITLDQNHQVVLPAEDPDDFHHMPAPAIPAPALPAPLPVLPPALVPDLDPEPEPKHEPEPDQPVLPAPAPSLPSASPEPGPSQPAAKSLQPLGQRKRPTWIPLLCPSEHHLDREILLVNGGRSQLVLSPPSPLKSNRVLRMTRMNQMSLRMNLKLFWLPTLIPLRIQRLWLVLMPPSGRQQQMRSTTT